MNAKRKRKLANRWFTRQHKKAVQRAERVAARLNGERPATPEWVWTPKMDGVRHFDHRGKKL